MSKVSIILTVVCAALFTEASYSADPGKPEIQVSDAWAKNKGTILDACNESWKANPHSETLGQLRDATRTEIRKHKKGDKMWDLFIAEEKLEIANKQCATEQFKKATAKMSGKKLMAEIQELLEQARSDESETHESGCFSDSENIVSNQPNCAMYYYRTSQISFLFQDGLIDSKGTIHFSVLDASLTNELASSNVAIGAWSKGLDANDVAAANARAELEVTKGASAQK